MRPEWRDFSGGVWKREINVRDFIQKNYTPYDGDDSSSQVQPRQRKDLWAQVMDLSAKKERPAVCWIWIRKLFPPSPPMDRAISIRIKKNCRFSDRQALQAFLTALRRHPHGGRRPVRTTATPLIRRLRNSLPFTERLTTQVYSTLYA